MAATENDSISLQLDEEVEGERIGSHDYCFIEVGGPVPMKSGDDCEFDPQSPPSKPLSISERFGIVFVSHSTGFCVARTKDIIDSSKEIAEKGSGSSIKELSIVDVLIGPVYILALSADSSTLAACIDGNIHFFSVALLLSKEQSPSFLCSLDDSSCVKDMQWTKKLENYYLVLSNHGKLFYGAGQYPLTHVMDNVDAFDWSVKGNMVAVARKNTLSIMSSKLKEKVSMSLSFESWIGDSDLNCRVKVDSIRWVRRDSIILGCFQLTSDGKEENYLVQVITSKDGKFTDTSSKPIVLSFSDVFEAFVDDIVPFGSGPYMSVTYLNTCELAIAANRKSTDRHIVLFGWSMVDKKEATFIDNLRDTLRPNIPLQGDDDDNIVLGLCVDRISQNEKVEVQLGADYKELSPFCILLCLSLDGKLLMYQVASVTGPSVPSDNVSLLSDEEDDTPSLGSSEDAKPDTSSGLVVKNMQVGVASQSHEVNKKELLINEGHGVPVANVPMHLVNSATLEALGQQKFLLTKVNQDTEGQQSLLSAPEGQYFGHSSPKTESVGPGPGPVVRDFRKEESKMLPEGGSSAVSLPGKFSSHVSSQSLSTSSPRAVDLAKGLPEKLESASPKGASLSLTSNAKHTSLTSGGGFSLVPPGSIQSNRSDNSGTNTSSAHFPGVPFGNLSYATGPSTTFASSGRLAYSGGQSTSARAGIAEPLPAIRSSVLSCQQNFTPGNSSKDKFHPSKEKCRAASSARPLISEPRLSKQFGNVEEMIKGLETLLECIEGAGGFRDACTVLQESSVLELEEGIGTLFNRCRLSKSVMDERLGEIQHLLDNTVQVLARKSFMDGIIKQATDGQYLDLWNRRELSSELELKQQHISKLNQELTNQLVELERHLNTLELNKFGGSDGVRMSQRAFPGIHGRPRNVQSVHSLRNTMCSQLAAAEQLSECLTKQMAVLSIEPPSVKTQNVKRELFEEIGIPYTPEGKVAGDTNSKKEISTSSCSDAGKGQSRRNARRGCESETARRRRDSLDRNWASFEPPKTTVQRMLLHDDRVKASTDRSALLDKKHVKSHVLEGSAVARAKRYNTTSKLFYPSEEQGIQDTPTKQASVLSSHSASISSTNAAQNNMRGSFYPTANLSSNGVTVIEKPDSLSVNGSESIHKSQIELHQISSVSKRLHGQTLSLPKKPSETPDSNDKETDSVKSTIGYGKHHTGITKSSFVESGKGLESPFSYSSVPAPNLNAEIFQSDIAASKSQTGRVASSSPTLLLSTSSSPSPPLSHSSLLLPSLPPNPTEQISSLPISIGRSSTSSKPSTNGSQTTLLSQLSGSSSSILPSVTSYQVPEKAVPSPIPIPSLNFETESPKREQQAPIPKLSSATDQSSTIRGSSQKNEPGFTLKLESSLPFRGGGEPSANLQSGSNLSFDGNATVTTNEPSNFKLDLSFTTDDVSAAVLSTSGSANGGKSECANVTVSQEDEMEEEAPETSQTTELTLGSLGSFGIGSSPNPTHSKSNPFGGTFPSMVPTPATSPFSMTVPTGELFRPASFSFQSPQPFQPSQLTSFGAFSSGLSTGTTQISAAGSGFGQPAQLGSGQQALGSVLGAFGQSRQLGGVVPGTSPSSASGFSGGFVSSPSTGGFAASSGGGFAGAAPAGGGFAAAASAGGGFAGAASAGGGFGGGFGGITSAGGGFAAPASAGGGFAGAASGIGFPSSGSGFGAFNSQQGSGGFSAFGSSAGGTGSPPSQLITQMRK